MKAVPFTHSRKGFELDHLVAPSGLQETFHVRYLFFLYCLVIRECESLFPSPYKEESLQCPNVRKKDATVTKEIAQKFLLVNSFLLGFLPFFLD